MVNINIAYTSRINPAGATPVLNEAQIWAGLQRKIRFAQEFVPVIESCEVLEEKDGVVTRDVKFKRGTGPKDQAKEVVRSYWPSWVSGTRSQRRYLKHDETFATPQFDVGNMLTICTQVDFEQEDGSHVRNIISDGPSGETEDLNMTYAFEWIMPNLQEGTPEADKERQRLKGVSTPAHCHCHTGMADANNAGFELDTNEMIDGEESS